jgi:hypothetical protein
MMANGVATAGSANGHDGAVSLAVPGHVRPARPEADPSGALSASRFPLSGIPALLSVETAVGPCAVGELASGTVVRSLAGGWGRVVAAVTIRHDLARGDATPVMVRNSALGAGPGRDLTLPATQRIVIDSPRAVQVAGARRVAVPVANMVHLSDVRPLALSTATFVHVLLDGIDAVLAEGLWFETFRPCPAALASLGHEGRRAMLAAAPRMVHRSGHAQYVPPWRALSAREAEEVI